MRTTTRVYDRDRLRVVTVVSAVAGQVWALVVLVAVLGSAALAWYVYSGDRMTALLGWWLVRHTLFGLVGSFALHEVAHVLALRRISTVRRLVVERTPMRISILPVGELTPVQLVTVAVVGPAGCAAFGAVLALTGLAPGLACWYLAQIVFLLPLFGDGRAAVLAWRRHRAAVSRARPAGPADRRRRAARPGSGCRSGT